MEFNATHHHSDCSKAKAIQEALRALFLAVRSFDLEGVEAALRVHGVNVDAREGRRARDSESSESAVGETAEEEDCLATFIDNDEAGRDDDDEEDARPTALMVASVTGGGAKMLPIVRALVENGASILRRADADSFTPLHHAAMATDGDISILEYFISKLNPEDLDPRDFENYTPLHMAIIRESMDADDLPAEVKCRAAVALVRAGASLTTHTIKGRDAVSYAVEDGLVPVVRAIVARLQLLEESGDKGGEADSARLLNIETEPQRYTENTYQSVEDLIANAIFSASGAVLKELFRVAVRHRSRKPAVPPPPHSPSTSFFGSDLDTHFPLLAMYRVANSYTLRNEHRTLVGNTTMELREFVKTNYPNADKAGALCENLRFLLENGSSVNIREHRPIIVGASSATTDDDTTASRNNWGGEFLNEFCWEGLPPAAISILVDAGADVPFNKFP